MEKAEGDMRHKATKSDIFFKSVDSGMDQNYFEKAGRKKVGVSLGVKGGFFYR